MSPMTDQEKQDLKKHNAVQIDQMDVAAGSVIKHLVQTLKHGNRNTYIKLRNAALDGHIVFYDLVEGDQELVYKFGRILQLETVTDDMLEVRS